MLLSSVIFVFNSNYIVINVHADGENWDPDLTSWSYRKLITLDASQISGTNLNYPILINISSDSDLASDAQNAGEDIVFVDYYDNDTQFSHEIEYFNGGTGKLVAWVNDTELSSTDYKIWMYYGNLGCASQQDISGTWDSHFTHVLHMNGTAYTDIYDSAGSLTISNQYGTPEYQQPGMAWYAVDLEQDSSESWVTSTIAIPSGSTITVECWTKPEDLSGGVTFGTDNPRIICQGVSSAIAFFRFLGTAINIGVHSGSSYYEARTDQGVLTQGVWCYVAGVFTPSSKGKLYHNGDIQTNTAFDDTFPASWDQGNVEFFSYQNSYRREFDGTVDEIRFSDIERSADYLLTTYNCIANATDGGFFSVGFEEEQAGATLPSVTTITATGVEETNGTIRGTLSSNGSADTTCYFIYGNSTPPTENNDSQGVINNGATFTYNWQSLNPGSIHYYYALAHNSEGWDNDSGNIKGFLTKPNNPTGGSCIGGVGWINISWSSATGADKYRVEYDTDGTPPETVGSGTLLCNTTALYYNTSISNNTFYFSIWSFCAEGGLHQYSDIYNTTSGYQQYAPTWYSLNFGGKATVVLTDPPQFTNPASFTNTTGVSLSETTWNITITDDGGVFNWTIQTSPNCGSNSGNDDTNGSKTITLSLECGTTYTIYVNATDGEGVGRGGWVRKTYWFRTVNCPIWYERYFGGSAYISGDTIDIDVDPDTWTGGAPLCGSDIQNNFTFYQNGTATVRVDIGFNVTNYTFVNYTTWLSDGCDQYCANFTINSWSSESMIEPKSGDTPVTVLKNSLSGDSNFEFGIRIWMPKGVTVSGVLEDFGIMLVATDIG